ncbi:MAG: tRNA (adenosine(37)-N6)-threonylcarbamoyltransferase complex dimerization subunit type 1 TsaB [Pseudomonadota bacterium]|nr:tRNA (adenosine(37)-N6)-threonylcarbamoyltransferase complex dimerization subunit type 1 TsaB [Pseudomonadota bacterium]
MGPLRAIETSAAQCAAAILVDGRVAAERLELMSRGQAERLMPMIAELLAELSLAPRDLGAVAVCEGPGNFTGIRIAVAAARGLALSTGRPALGVGRLDALAETEAWGLGLRLRGGDPDAAPLRLVVTAEARRDEILAQAFEIRAGEPPRPLAPLEQGAPEALADGLAGALAGSMVGGPVRVTGPAAPRLSAMLEEAGVSGTALGDLGDLADPAAIGRLGLAALARLAPGEAPTPPAPRYPRPADAAPSREVAPALLPDPAPDAPGA